MGNFTNTKISNTIDSLVEGFKNKLNNPYYLHSDKNKTIVDYLKINHMKSTLDEGIKTEYSKTGDNSPIRYDLVSNFIIYGVEQIVARLNFDESGVKSDRIEGVAYILPNTIKPTPGDFFIINHMNKKWLFCVSSINIDTVESGANFYEINYYLDAPDTIDDIMNQVIEEYKFIVQNNGTEFNSVIVKNDYDFIARIEKTTSKLKSYFHQLFYSPRVDTYILLRNKISNCYDPYLIEFLIRNDIMDSDKQFTYISHKLVNDRLFNIKYDNTFFKAIESKDMSIIERCNNMVNATIVDHKRQPLSSLTQRLEPYFCADYFKATLLQENGDMTDSPLWHNYTPTYCVFEADLLYSILTNAPNGQLEDIFIYYLNNQVITDDLINIIENYEYTASDKLFYFIPIIIYILEKYCKDLMLKQNI